MEKELIDAAVDGKTEEVIRLLDGGVNIDATDEVRNVCSISLQMYAEHVHVVHFNGRVHAHSECQYEDIGGHVM